MNVLRQGALSYPCLRKKDRLAVPVYGPVLLLVLAGCNTTSHTGPKPATGASGTPFVAATIDGLKGPDTMSFAKAEARIYADLATEGAQADKAVFFRDGVSAGEGVETSAGAASGTNLDAYTHLVGTGFADHLLGDEQNNIIVGEGGDDLIEGRAGEDQLYGAYGNDRLHGGGGRDSLYGGDGDDVLDGGSSGRDTLWGGAGADKFVLKQSLLGSAHIDTIKDYASSEGDRIQIDTAARTETTLAALGLKIVDNGSHANIRNAAGNQTYVIIENVDHALIIDANFTDYFEVL